MQSNSNDEMIEKVEKVKKAFLFLLQSKERARLEIPVAVVYVKLACCGAYCIVIVVWEEHVLDDRGYIVFNRILLARDIFFVEIGKPWFLGGDELTVHFDKGVGFWLGE
jgi:hypothetical protein